MKTLSIHVKPDQVEQSIDKLKALSPDLIIVMAATDRLKAGQFSARLHDALPNCQLIGCSTSGEIGYRGVTDDGFEVAAAKFEKGYVATTNLPLTGADQSRQVGVDIAGQLLKTDLRAIFVLAPGTNINGSELVAGLRSTLPPDVIITGGLAGDGTRFAETVTLINGALTKEHVVAVGFYGPDFVIGAGSRGGWKPFGPTRRVTRAAANILYELDGKPALDLYKEYLGDKASQLPSSALLYPLAILGQDRAETGLIRTILNIDAEAKSLVLAGDIPVNSQVCLMHADTKGLADGSTNAAREALGAMDHDGAGLAICVSCVGRRLVMGEDVDDEIDNVRSVLGDDANLIGFYSYGEIAPFLETRQPELHNQTMTITYIRERVP